MQSNQIKSNKSNEYQRRNELINEYQLSQTEWKPDFGVDQLVPRWGATATGVRKFLIAYNINVVGTKEQAHRSFNLNQFQQPCRHGNR